MANFVQNVQDTFANLLGTSNAVSQQNQQRPVLIPWGTDSFPRDGSGKTIQIAPGQPIEFRPIDGQSHNVAEAVIEKTDSEPSGRRWIPHPQPQLNMNYKTRRHFNETLTIQRPGRYHFVCPIDGHHRVMRLTVDVGDQQQQNPFQGLFGQQQNGQNPLQSLFGGQQQQDGQNPFQGLFGGQQQNGQNPFQGLFGGLFGGQSAFSTASLLRGTGAGEATLQRNASGFENFFQNLFGGQNAAQNGTENAAQNAAQNGGRNGGRYANIAWDTNNFRQRRPRQMTVPSGTHLNFESTDGELHDVMETGPDFSPYNARQVGQNRPGRELRTSTYVTAEGRPRTRYFTDAKHPHMRLVCNVHPY